MGVFGTDSLLARPRRKMFLVVFVVRGMVMVTCSGSVLFSSSSMSGIFLSLLLLCHLIAATGPVVCFGIGGCLDLVVLVTRTLGLPLLVIKLSVTLSGELAFDGSVWRTAEDYGDSRLERCRGFLPVLGVMQTVQRAEFWGATVASQACWSCHLGIDNLNVARTAGRLLDKGCIVKFLPLVNDRDLVALVQYMIRTRGRETVRVTEVEGHAEDIDLQHGQVRVEHQVGNAEADTAADLGRRHQSEVLIDARRRLLKARSYWYPIILDLHRFMIAIARVSVNHDGRGGTAPDPLDWDQGGRPKARKIEIRVNVDLASLPGPPGFLGGPWIQVYGGSICGADTAAWPQSVGILFRFTSFLRTLHWPAGSDDMGHFGFLFWNFLPF